MTNNARFDSPLTVYFSLENSTTWWAHSDTVFIIFTHCMPLNNQEHRRVLGYLHSSCQVN